MPSDIEEAFEEALDSAEEAKGRRETVTFRGEELDAIIHDVKSDPNFLPGGSSSILPVNIDLRTSDVTPPIESLEPIVVRGVTMGVLTFSFLAGRVAITAGDPTLELDSI